MRCDLCDEIWDGPKYSDTECPKCGQKYIYDENHFPLLGDRQKKALENLDALEKDADRYRKLRAKHWSDGGIIVLESASSAPIGSMTLSLERLDDALDSEEHPARKCECHVDTVSGIPGAEIFVNGTADNPVHSYEEAKVLVPITACWSAQ
jgi:hypothetical protein